MVFHLCRDGLWGAAFLFLAFFLFVIYGES